MTPRVQCPWVDAPELARVIRRIRVTNTVPGLRAIAFELERDEADDGATLALLRMIALKVVRIERSN